MSTAPNNPPPDDNTPIVFTQGMWEDMSSQFSYLKSLVADLQLDKENLEKAHADEKERVNTLEITVLECVARIQQLEAKPTTLSRPYEPKIADPPMFMGERKAILPFLAKCRLKFSGQPSMFPTEQAKVIYAGSRLEGPPFSWFTPLNNRLNDPEATTPLELATFDAFAKALTTLYGDPHLTLTAEREMRALRHTDTVAIYIAKFEEHRQYLSWNDEALRDQFYLGLKDRIKDSMAHLDRPQTLTAMKEIALRLDARLNARWEERQSAKNTNNPGSQSSRTPWSNRASNPSSSAQATPSGRATTLPASSTGTSTIPTPTNQSTTTSSTPRQNFPTHTPDGTVPMELGSRGWQLTNAEKQRRRSNNLCLYCADPGHRAFACPSAPPMRTMAPTPSVPRFQRQAFMNIDISHPSTIIPTPSPSAMSVISQDTPSENSYTRE
ncbi:MAG TPA: hypothetical protein VIW22_02770 [Nitrososphaerales archaeon]